MAFPLPARPFPWRAVLLYLVPTPLKPLPARRGGPEIERHYRQAMGLSVALVGIALLYGAIFVVETSCILLRGRAWPSYPWDQVPDYFAGGLLVVWLGFWVAGTALAAWGSARRLPGVARLGEVRALRGIARGATTAGWVLCLLVVGLVADTLSRVRGRDGKPARVYVLYDEAIPGARWGMAVGVWRLVRAAEGRWGPGEVVLAPISAAALVEAFEVGELVIVASHGLDGELEFGDGARLGPDELWVARRKPPERLRLAYLTGCWTGTRGPEWRGLLAPAEVRTFGQESATAQHAWWLWLEAPGRVKRSGGSDVGGAPAP